jgi:hypothetical protein
MTGAVRQQFCFAAGPACFRLVLFSTLLSLSLPVHADPLNLFDSRPREIAVAFEISPRDVPAQMNTRYSQDFQAFLEPGLRDSEVRVIIPSRTVEEHLLGDQMPIRESFSDFVWTFDVETGHVVSAHLTGRVTPLINWGIITTHTQADIEVEMGTARAAGFRRPLRLMGQLIFRYCTNLADPDCQFVESTPLDRETGYVNAIGQVWVRSAFVDVWNFSPMGEAIFREIKRAPDAFVEGASGVGFSLPAGLVGMQVEADPALLQDGRAVESN